MDTLNVLELVYEGWLYAKLGMTGFGIGAGVLALVCYYATDWW